MYPRNFSSEKLVKLNAMIKDRYSHNLINFQLELNIIKQIAINNGYVPYLIDKMVEKELFKQAIALVYPPAANLSPQKYHVCTFVQLFSLAVELLDSIHFSNPP